MRFLFGAGEAGAFPGMARAVYSWIPVRERGLVKGINFSASRLGAAVTMPLLPWLIATLGWKAIVRGADGGRFRLGGGWWLWFRDEPAEHPGIRRRSSTYIHATGRRKPRRRRRPAAALPARALLRSGNLWLMMGQYFASNFTFFFCLSWLFPYVQKTYGSELHAGGILRHDSAALRRGGQRRSRAGSSMRCFALVASDRFRGALPAMIGFALAAVGLVMSAGQASAAARCSGCRSRFSART